MLLMVADQVSQSIQFSPLVPLINDLIAALGAILTAAVPVLTYFAITWLRQHGIALNAQAQTELIKQADNLIGKGIAYSTVVTDDSIGKLKVSAPSPAVAAAANYAIAQAPDPLKKLGFDPGTPEGQAAIVRMVLARLTPSPPIADANVTVTAAPQPAPQPLPAPAG